MAIGVVCLAPFAMVHADAPVAAAPAETSLPAPNGMKLIVKMIGPTSQPTDLQIICLLKHRTENAGDQYLDAMKGLNEKLGGLLRDLRQHGDFAGDAGETLLFTPPPNSIPAHRMLLIGVGDESALTVDILRLVGRIAARESTRIGAANISFAPTLRDQGSDRIDVAEGDAAFADGVILAYDAERRLQSRGLAPKADIESFTIEAGKKYYEAVVKQEDAAINDATNKLNQRRQNAPSPPPSP
jgi:hypothetical protein